MSATQYLKATHISGIDLYVELASREVMGAIDCFDDKRTLAFEDRDGEMIAHDVRIADLENIRPE